MTAFKNTIESPIVTEEVMSPHAYIALVNSNPTAIKKVSFVPPKQGSKDFGKFSVEYRTPKLNLALG